MKVEGRDLRAVWWDADEQCVAMVDQRRLPRAVVVHHARTVAQVVDAIRGMVVRGAPTIGATAAYGLLLADDAEEGAQALAGARPTARDLFSALEWMAEGPVSLARADAYADEVVARCRRIGTAGLEVLRRHARPDGSVRMATHCHAGAWAAVDVGTALAPLHVWAAGDRALAPFVWVDETRPRLQGGLTAWELGVLGVPHRLQVDAAAAARLARGEVDVVVTGADRIAANGDVANKIGTYGLALAARAHGVPFYVAAPGSTFDPGTAVGSDIVIEERDGHEVRGLAGPALHAGVEVANPAFDVTPAALVSGYLTEHGLVDAARLRALAPLRPPA